MIARFDSRVLGDIVSDDGVSVDETVLATNPKLLASINSASGEVEASVIAGGMYTVANLTALDGNAEALLVDIVCCIAMCKLLKRRVAGRTDELMKVVCEDAKEFVERLRRGDAVFGGTDNATDGSLPETTGPTTATFQNLNMIRDRVPHYYPQRVLPFRR